MQARGHAQLWLGATGVALCSLLAAHLFASNRSMWLPGTRHAKAAPLPVAKKRAAPSPPTSAIEARIFACASGGPFSCDIRDLGCQEALFELATCIYDRRSSRPELGFVGSSALREERARERARSRALDFALERLGMAEADTERPVDDEGPTFTAFYAPLERRILVATTGAVATRSEVARSVLVHEYVHSLQDADGSLARSFATRGDRTFDADLAARAAVEGEATFYETAVRAAHLRQQIPEVLSSRFRFATRYADEHIARQRFPATASFALFPYAYGAQWATRRMLGETRPAVLALAAPVSTRAMMAEVASWPSAEAPSCRADEDERQLLRAYPSVVVDTLGSWLVQTLVQKRSNDASRAKRAAQLLADDRLYVYADEAGRQRFLWRTCWSSPASADAMSDLLSTATPRELVLNTEVIGSALVVRGGE